MDDEIVIGRLKAVPAREVWRHEALDFTPWLLDNADVLSEVIGLDLELDTAEHAVGDFSLDLIGRDRISGDLVIVENQLEQSDHTHLGQIMTYAGGTDAAHVVWVAPSFRPEHRRALEWLNERTDEATRFFAVEVKAVRIGDSPYAPLLSLAVQPNDWGKQVRTKAVQQSGSTWSSSDLMPAVRAETTPEVADAIAALMSAHEALGPGAGFYYGTARSPSVTATMSAGALRAQPWSVFTHLGVVWTLNLDWIHKQGRVLSADFMESLASELGDLPGLDRRLRGREGGRVAQASLSPRRTIVLPPGCCRSDLGCHGSRVPRGRGLGRGRATRVVGGIRLVAPSRPHGRDTGGSMDDLRHPGAARRNSGPTPWAAHHALPRMPTRTSRSVRKGGRCGRIHLVRPE